MGRFVCKKCGSKLTFKMFPFWNSGWFCPICGKIDVKWRRKSK